jgi:cobalamin synthase
MTCDVSFVAQSAEMPSLFRFLTVVAIIVGVIYGAIFALANFVNPKPREITVTVPPDKFLKK